MNRRQPKKLSWQPLVGSDAPAWLLALALGASSLGCSLNKPSSLSLTKKTPAVGVVEENEAKGPLGKVSTAMSNTGKSIAGVFKRDPSKSKKPSEPVDPIALKTKSKLPGADFYVMVAELKERSGDITAAEEQYNKALELEKNYLPACLGLAHLYDNQGQMQKATEAYKDAVKKHPKEAAPHNDLGLCYARQTKYAEAAAELRQAVDLQPDRALYHNNLATVLVELDRPQDALEQLMVGQKPAVAHYNLGYLLTRSGRNDDAAKQFASALEKDPNFDAARQSLEQVLAKSAELNGTSVALQPTPRSSSSELSPSTNIYVGQNPTVGPDYQTRPNRGAVITSDPAEGLTPINEMARDNTPPQQAPASQVRPVRDLAPLAPLRSAAKPAPLPTEPDVGPATPPTPDQLREFSKSVGPNAEQARLQPLPPVNSAYYPPSRY